MQEKYTISTRLLHWLIALVVVFLFGLGLWMDSLDYYHDWYQKAPALHVGVGVFFLLLLVLRVANRLILQKPLLPISTLRPMEVLGAKVVHVCMYLVMGFMAISGYWLAGLDSGSVSVFGWFDLPGFWLVDDVKQDAISDMLKHWHEVAAKVLVFIALLHAAAALKHHFIDKDNTLKRMLRDSLTK